jgi:hypothetical protein
VSILTARLPQLLVLTGVNAASLRTDRLRKLSVAAFGAAEPILLDRYLLVDGVAWRVRDELAGQGMVRRAAAMITRAFFDKWIEAVARIEHRCEPVVFAVAEQSAGVWWCGTGNADGLADYVRTQSPLRRLFVVNVEQILAGMKHRGERADFDLRGNFFLPPDHPLFTEWIAEFAARRTAVPERFDPLHMRPPRAPDARQRRAIEDTTCGIYLRA